MIGGNGSIMCDYIDYQDHVEHHNEIEALRRENFKKFVVLLDKVGEANHMNIEEKAALGQKMIDFAERFITYSITEEDILQFLK